MVPKSQDLVTLSIKKGYGTIFRTFYQLSVILNFYFQLSFVFIVTAS